jgi:hypothetical protein
MNIKTDLKKALVNASNNLPTEKALEKQHHEDLLKKQQIEAGALEVRWKNNPRVGISLPEMEIPKHLILTTIKGFANATILYGEGGNHRSSVGA